MFISSVFCSVHFVHPVRMISDPDCGDLGLYFDWLLEVRLLAWYRSDRSLIGGEGDCR